MKKLLLAGSLLSAFPASAQLADSLRITVGTTATAATRGYQPLWVVANRYGTIADQQADASTFLRVQNQHSWGSRPAAADTAARGPRRAFFAGYGAALYNNRHLNSTFLAEGYARAGYGPWQLRAGRYRETTGEIDPTLSSGSLGISGNALPIPKIELAVTDYTPVPFTHGWVQFRGQLVHGWWGSTPDIKGAYLHQKALYLRVGKKRLRFYGGLTHFAQWGGTFASGQAPSRFKDYVRIFLGASGDGGDPVYHQGPVDISNAVGNHILVPEFGLSFQKNRSTFRLYTQTIFDKGVGDSVNTDQRDRLAGLKILWRDRLAGLSWETSQPHALVQKVLLEGLYTKYQGGATIYVGRDNYYNNGTYNMGWQYHERIVGTPLFLNQQNAANYQLNLDQAYYWAWSATGWWRCTWALKAVFRNASATGCWPPTCSTTAIITTMSAFTPGKQQSHLLLEIPCQFNHFSITAGVGSDLGDLSNNTAGLLRAAWQLH